MDHIPIKQITAFIEQQEIINIRIAQWWLVRFIIGEADIMRAHIVREQNFFFALI